MQCEIKNAKLDITQKLRDVATFLSNPTQEDLLKYKNLKLEATRRTAKIYAESKLNLKLKDFDKILAEVGLTSYNLPYKVNEGTASMQVLENLSIDRNFLIFNNHNSAYTQVYNYFLKNLTKYTFLNLDRDAVRHYISSSEDFNEGFIDLKNYLVQVILSYLNSPVEKIFTPFGGNFKVYSNLMEKVNTLFLPNFDLEMDISTNQLAFEVFAAAYILNNFDALVEEVIGEMVDIDTQLKGDINNTSYAKNFLSKSTVYWLNDTHEAKNAKNFTSNITKFLVRQIPKVTVSPTGEIQEIPGQFLDVPDLFLMSSVLKLAEYEYNLLHQNSQIDFFSDQKYALKTLLTLSKEEVELIPVLKKFQNQLISLKTYLYTGTSKKMPIAEMYAENVLDNLKILDVEGLFAFEIGKTAAPSYISYGEHGVSNLINYSQAYNSSQLFIFNIENLLYVDADSADPILKKSAWFNNLKEKSFETLKEDQIFLKLVLDLLGISIKNVNTYDNFFLEKLDPTDIYSNKTRFDYFKDLLSNIANKAISSGLSEEEKITSVVLSVKLISNPGDVRNFNLFKLATSPLFNDIPRTTFENSEGNSISVYRLNSLFLDDNHLILNYKKTHGENSEKYNFFVANPIVFSANNVRIVPGNTKTQVFNAAYLGSTAIKLEASALDSSLQASKLSPEALIIASYIGDFLSLKGFDSNGKARPTSDMMGVLVACFSDKITVLLKMINLASEIQLVNGEVSSLQKLLNDLEKLLLLDYYYRKNQILRLMNDILKDWSLILKLMPELSLGEILYLSNADLDKAIDNLFSIDSRIFNYWNTANEIIHKLSETQNWEEISSIATKLGINLAEELHFSKYKFKNKKGFYLNNSIFYTAKTLETFNTFKQVQEKNFKKFIQYKNNRVSNQIIDLIKAIKDSNNHLLVDAFFDKKSGDINYNAIKNSLKSYFFISNFLRHLYLDLTVKEPFLDPAKGNILEEADFNAINDPSKPNEYSDYAGAREYSLRMDASLKRMVIGPGTIENFLQNTLRGVSPKVKCAIIDDAKEEVFNASGSTHDLDIFDGCGFISPYESRMENESLPGKGATETKKTLGATFTQHTSSLFKWAEMILNNWKIRLSKGCKFDLEKMFKKMHSESIADIDITKNLFGQTISYKKLLDGKRIFYKLGFKHYEIIGLMKPLNTSNGIYQLKIRGVNNLGNPISELKTKSVLVDTIYDLWKVLGGYESEELVDNQLVYGDLNHDLIYELIVSVGKINEWGEELNQSNVVQPLRNKFIGIVANKSAVKRGIINTNSSEVWTNSEELSWFEVDTAMFGQQMDANHNAEEGDVTEPTLAMSALAALGYTQDLALEAYEQVATIIQNALKNVTRELKTSNIEGLSLSLSKRLIKEIVSGDKINLAPNIIHNLLEKDLNPILPFSDANFYKSLVKNIVVTLNKSTIKRRFLGLGGILNPSSNILQLYRINGKNYSFESLLKQAEKLPEDLKLAIEDVFLIYAFAKNSNTETLYLDPSKMSKHAVEQIFDDNGNLDWAKTLVKVVQLYLNDSSRFEEIDKTKLFELLQDKSGKEFSGLEEVPVSDINLLDYVYDEDSNKSYCLDTLEKYVDFIFKHLNEDVLRDTSYPTDLRPQLAEWAFVDPKTKEVTQVLLYLTPAAIMANIINKRKKIEGVLPSTIHEQGLQEIVKCNIS